jgi:hypothetical protein
MVQFPSIPSCVSNIPSQVLNGACAAKDFVVDKFGSISLQGAKDVASNVYNSASSISFQGTKTWVAETASAAGPFLRNGMQKVADFAQPHLAKITEFVSTHASKQNGIIAGAVVVVGAVGTFLLGLFQRAAPNVRDAIATGTV